MSRYIRSLRTITQMISLLDSTGDAKIRDASKVRYRQPLGREVLCTVIRVAYEYRINKLARQLAASLIGQLLARNENNSRRRFAAAAMIILP